MQIQHAIINENFFAIKTISQSPNPSCKLHYHDHYELYFLQKGHREYLINNEIIEVYTDDILLIKPGIIHQTFGSKFERILVQFNNNAFENIFSQQLIDEIFSNNPDYILSTASEDIKNCFIKLHEAYCNNDVILSTIVTLEILFFIKQNARSPITICNPASSELLTSIRLYINQNFNILNTLDEIANHFFISKYYLSHLFKKNLGITVIEYLTHRKITFATTLLRTTNLPITEITTKSGFNSPAYFFKVFKTINKISPYQYRKHYNENYK